MFWHSQELAQTHADKVALAAAASLHGPCDTPAAKSAPRVQPGRRTGGRVHHACGVVHPFAVTVPAMHAQRTPCASAFSVTCRTPSGSVATCGGLHVSVIHPTRHTPAANARRFSHRAPALRPHRTDQISMRVRHAHNREGISGYLFGPPKIWVEPSPGFAVLPFVAGFAGREGGGQQEGGRRGGARPLPHWNYSISIAMRATRSYAEQPIALIRSMYACTV
jgi:hypothetical protein